MEAVRSFNSELSSLYEGKPPISRAKMASVTKTAMKAIKFYKHVVQSVEKFIQKCRPEFKVPGLYVIDSIVRQSRHQFGADKEVFAPRFTKNIAATFQHLFKCAPDERSKIIRVLNLWQKNNVFPYTVVQPLLDLASDPQNPEVFATVQELLKAAAGGGGVTTVPKQPPEPEQNGGGGGGVEMAAGDADNVQTDVLKAVSQLLEQSQQPEALSVTAQQQQLQQLQLLQQQLIQQSQMLQDPADTQQAPLIDSNLLAQIQALTNQLLGKSTTGDVDEAPNVMKPPGPAFDKKLLDFDYGESDEEEEMKETSNQPAVRLPVNMHGVMAPLDPMRLMNQVGDQLNQRHPPAMLLPTPPRGFIQPPNMMRPPPPLNMPPPPNLMSLPAGFIPPPVRPMMMPPAPLQTHVEPGIAPLPQLNRPMDDMQQPPPHMNEMFEQPQMGHMMPPPPVSAAVATSVPPMIDNDMMAGNGEEERRHGWRHRSRSRTPKRRRRSRSRSRDRRRRSRSREHRRRSRSRDRDGHRERDRERRDKEKDRRRRGLPPMKEGHLSICSTTLWLGHLSKMVDEVTLQEELSNFGEVGTLLLIPPRGCAYVCLTVRKDAARALDKLRGAKLLGSSLKAAWAANKGITASDFKSNWDVELGVTYIPWDSLEGLNLNALADGGVVDSETLPEHMKKAFAEAEAKKLAETNPPPDNNMMAVPPPMLPPPAGLPDISVPPQHRQMAAMPLPPQLPMPPPPASMQSMMPTHQMVPRGMMPMVPVGVLQPPPPQMMMRGLTPSMVGPVGLPGLAAPPRALGTSLPQATPLSGPPMMQQIVLPPGSSAPTMQSIVGQQTQQQQQQHSVNESIGEPVFGGPSSTIAIHKLLANPAIMTAVSQLASVPGICQPVTAGDRPSVMQDAGNMLVGPGGLIQRPSGIVQGANAMVQGPGGLIQRPGPGGIIQRPPNIIQRPAGIVQGPAGLLQGPAGMLRGLGAGAMIRSPGGLIRAPGGLLQRPDIMAHGPRNILTGFDPRMGLMQRHVLASNIGQEQQTHLAQISELIRAPSPLLPKADWSTGGQQQQQENNLHNTDEEPIARSSIQMRMLRVAQGINADDDVSGIGRNRNESGDRHPPPFRGRERSDNKGTNEGISRDGSRFRERSSSREEGGDPRDASSRRGGSRDRGGHTDESGGSSRDWSGARDGGRPRDVGGSRDGGATRDGGGSRDGGDPRDGGTPRDGGVSRGRGRFPSRMMRPDGPSQHGMMGGRFRPPGFGQQSLLGMPPSGEGSRFNGPRGARMMFRMNRPPGYRGGRGGMRMERPMFGRPPFGDQRYIRPLFPGGPPRGPPNLWHDDGPPFDGPHGGHEQYDKMPPFEKTPPHDEQPRNTPQDEKPSEQSRSDGAISGRENTESRKESEGRPARRSRWGHFEQPTANHTIEPLMKTKPPETTNKDGNTVAEVPAKVTPAAAVEVQTKVAPAAEVSAKVTPPAEVPAKVTPAAAVEVQTKVAPAAEVPAKVPPPAVVLAKVALPAEVPAKVALPVEVPAKVAPPAEVPAKVAPPAEVAAKVAPLAEVPAETGAAAASTD